MSAASVIATASSGLPELDGVLGGVFWGDNVVWEPDDGVDVEPFFRAIAQHHDTYRFAGYVTVSVAPESVRAAYPGLDVIDGRPGSELDRPDALLDEIRHRCQRFERALLLFDPLDRMAEAWDAEATRLFFSRCCPLLLDLGAIAYWAISPRHEALRQAVEEVTQCVFRVSKARLRIVKAEGRPPSVQGMVFRYRRENGRPLLESAPFVTRLGAALRALRLERGLSQSEVARIAGVSASAVSQAERGQRGLSLETLLGLAAKLGMTLDELLRGEVAPGYRLARRHEPARRGETRPLPLLDDPGAGLRAFLVRIPPGEVVSPKIQHAGSEMVAVASGLVQTALSAGRPVLREGEALLVEEGPVQGWRNLGDREALLFWILRDPKRSSGDAD
jgi:transcriptional regulator with XRE-family HTH domain